MSQRLVPFAKGDTRPCRGRNLFNADAIGVEVVEKEDALRIFGRVASNKKTHIGYVSMPNDPILIQDLINALQAQLCSTVDANDLERAQNHEWVTSTNSSVKLGEISNRHLLNLIKFLRRQIAEVRETEEEALASWADDKISIGFTGYEHRIERLEETLKYAKIELKRRTDNRIAVDDPQDPDEIPFS